MPLVVLLSLAPDVLDSGRNDPTPSNVQRPASPPTPARPSSHRMDVDRPDDLAPPPPAPPVLLLHETVAGWPSPPASFLATVRLRKACAVSSIVVVPVGEAVFEHAALDSFG